MSPVVRSIESLDWMTTVLVVSLLILTLGKYLSHNRFLNFLRLPFNNKYMAQSNKKGRLFHWFHILISVFQYANLALFLLLMKRAWDGTSPENTFNLFLIIISFVVAFHLLKILLQLFKGFAFNTLNFITDMIYRKVSYFNYSSLVMFLGNVILIYTAKDSKTVIYTVLGLVLLINTIGLTKLLKNHQKLISYHLFYFILYLCALEIAPLVVIGSFLKG